MDFVVVGVGLGALAVLVGLLLRERGGLVRRAADRTVRRGGGLLAAAGGLLLLATGLALMLGLDDRAGAVVVLAVLALAVAAGIGWSARALPRRSPPVRAARAAAAGTALAHAGADDADGAPAPPLPVRPAEVPEDAILPFGDESAADSIQGGLLVAAGDLATVADPDADGPSDADERPSFDDGDTLHVAGPLAAEDASPDDVAEAAASDDAAAFDAGEPEPAPGVDAAAWDAVGDADPDHPTIHAASPFEVALARSAEDADARPGDREASSDPVVAEALPDDHPAALLNDPGTGEPGSFAASDEAIDADAPRLRIIPTTPDRNR